MKVRSGDKRVSVSRLCRLHPSKREAQEGVVEKKWKSSMPIKKSQWAVVRVQVQERRLDEDHIHIARRKKV